MPSTITERVGGAVEGVVVQRRGYGRIRLVPTSGTDDIIAEGSPSVPLWVDYQEFIMRPLGANVGNVRVNPDGLGFKELVMPNGTSQLQPGDITQFQDVQFYYSANLDKLVMLGTF